LSNLARCDERGLETVEIKLLREVAPVQIRQDGAILAPYWKINNIKNAITMRIYKVRKFSSTAKKHDTVIKLHSGTNDGRALGI
jgi:hypothetical protein